MLRLNSLGFVGAIIVGIAALAPASTQEITIAVGSEPSTLDPQLHNDGGERQVIQNVH